MNGWIKEKYVSNNISTAKGYLVCFCSHSNLYIFYIFWGSWVTDGYQEGRRKSVASAQFAFNRLLLTQHQGGKTPSHTQQSGYLHE